MKYTFKEFQKDFPNDDACLDKVLEMRYGGNEFRCPSCKRQSKFHRIAKRRAYACQHCGHHVYPCVNTPFEKSRTPLTDWFFAMYLMTSTRHGVAAKEIERQLGCTYKTAWRMCHELRKLMASSDSDDPLKGTIEVDETLVGGKQVGTRRKGKKTTVFGLLEREGILRAGPVPNQQLATLEPLVLVNVIRGSNVYSDGHHGYRDLGRAGYRHRTVMHSRGEYMRGLVHTNSIEGFWARLKLSIRGTHIHVSQKHLWKYVSEFAYRQNFRSSHRLMFGRLVSGLSQPRLVES